MKRILVLMIGYSCFGSVIYAQYQGQSQGIDFEKALSWRQTLEKAKQEHKFIFVECYATWCGPCKQMDNDVFDKPYVGDFINTHFISIRVQADTGKADGDYIQSWYADAYNILKTNRVAEFPTYLFYSSDGKIVHRYTGAVADSNFIAIAMDALKSETQYYTRLELYREGNMKYSEMPKVALEADENGDEDIALRISMDYVTNCLDKQSVEELLQSVNIDFMTSSIFGKAITSNDEVFHVITGEWRKVDSAMNYKGYHEILTNYLINKEIIYPTLWPVAGQKPKNPDWEVMEVSIGTKYGREFAEKDVLDAKLKWYQSEKDWTKVVQFTEAKIDKYGLDTTGLGYIFTNNTLYEVIFKHATNVTDLTKAAEWMRIIVDMHPNNSDVIDTYANILYKSGKIGDALVWEEKAVKLSSTKAVKGQSPNDISSLKETLQKMRSNRPTWPVN